MLSSEAPHAGLAVRGLRVAYRRHDGQTLVLGGVDLRCGPGRVLGIAGESGSGKTTAVLAAIGYTPPGAVREGEVALDGVALSALTRSQLRARWARDVSYVAQDAGRTLNPVRTIESQLLEVLENAGCRRADRRDRALELLHAVHLPEPEDVLTRYPHQLSGGQLQRLAIAFGLACEPKLLVLDEPTTGLDVTTQHAVVAMLTALIHERRIAAVYVSHDLALLAGIADDLAVMYAGEVVESGPAAAVMGEPRHPYTRALLDSLLSSSVALRPDVLPGLPPRAVVECACSFAPRCRWATHECLAAHPQLRVVGPGREARCLRAEALGPLASRRSSTAEPEPTRQVREPVLRGNGLTYAYRHARGSDVDAVGEVTLQLHKGEVVALVGESGSGKSTVARLIAGLLEPHRGAIALHGARLPTRASRRTRAQLRDIQLVFQDPGSSLNPRHTVGTLIRRPIALFRNDVPRAHARETITQALEDVRLDPALIDRYPHELSGGQKQRVAIARAFVARPSVVICDEIVSGLDVSVQAAILELLRDIQTSRDTAMLFITHDLSVVRSLAQYVYVMRHGRIVEEGTTAAVFDRPGNGYTEQLLTAARAMETE